MQKASVAAILAFALASCGGGSVPGGPGGAGNGTSVTAEFTQGRMPLSVAVQIGGSGSWNIIPVSGGVATFTVPAGTSKYAVAYSCPIIGALGNGLEPESIVEATTADSTSLPLLCAGNTPTTGPATGSVDASAIPAAGEVQIYGAQGSWQKFASLTGAFSVQLPAGLTDVAFVAAGTNAGAPYPNGIKIVRAQTLPGAVNGGNTVTFQSSDQVTDEPVTLNAPSGWSAPAFAAQYFTSGGTSINLNNPLVTNTYAAVPATEQAGGDFYFFESNDTNAATGQSVETEKTTSAAAGPVTLSLPAPWSYSGPQAATFPSFSFGYTGFAGRPSIAGVAVLTWNVRLSEYDSITIVATPAFTGGEPVTIPDLTRVPGFMIPAPSGAKVSWDAYVYGGSYAEWQLPLPPDGYRSYVSASGTYTEP